MPLYMDNESVNPHKIEKPSAKVKVLFDGWSGEDEEVTIRFSIEPATKLSIPDASEQQRDFSFRTTKSVFTHTLTIANNNTANAGGNGRIMLYAKGKTSNDACNTEVTIVYT